MKPPPARQEPRRRLSPEARREQLEVAAIETVARAGFAAATADAIAGRAGVSKGLLWHHYASLEDLLERAARRALDGLEAAVAEGLDLDGDVPGLLRDAVRRAAQLPRTHAAELQALRAIVPGLRRPDGTPVLGRADYGSLRERQAALLRRGQQRGELRADLDPDLLAITYQGLVDTMLDELQSDPSLDAEEYAEHVADVLLRGAVAPRRRRLSVR